MSERRAGPLCALVLLGATTAGAAERGLWAVVGDFPNAWHGGSLASAGDVNGDGFDDLLIGTPFRDDGAATWAGRAELYLGGPAGLAKTPAWQWNGQARQRIGSSVASAGDVNGDGFDDVLVGGGGQDDAILVPGLALLFLGSSSGLSAAPFRTFVDETQPSSRLGLGVASAGDVNADGFDDILIGAPGRDGLEEDEGAVSLYLGSAAGPSGAPAWTATSGTRASGFGFALGTAGDVNGDGFDDVVVGAQNWAVWNFPFFTPFGRVYVYHGSAAGLGASAAQVLQPTQVSTEFGVSVGTAGDVNGDGFDDVIVGAPEWFAGLPDQGAAFVYLGSPAGIGSTPAWTTVGTSEVVVCGTSVAGAGDLNADGFDDVVVGVPWYPGFPNQPDSAGQALVFHGSAAGLPSAPSWRLTGQTAAANVGRTVAAAGDVNGDGVADVAVAAPFESFGGTDFLGVVRVRHGRP